MDTRKNLNILVIDPDPFTTRKIAMFLANDPRVSKVRTAVSCLEALDALSKGDAMYFFERLHLVFVNGNLASLGGHIGELRKAIPGAMLICLGLDVDAAQVESAISAGANGFFHKEDILYGLVNGALRAAKGRFLYTTRIQKSLPARPRCHLDHVPSWRPSSNLTAQFRQVYELREMEGLSAAAVARILNLAVGSVNRYMNEIYKRLSYDSVIDVELMDFEGIAVEKMKSKEQAFLLYTGLPA